MSTAERLKEEGRQLGRTEGEERGTCKAAYTLRNMLAEGRTLADACLHFDALAGLDKQSTDTKPPSEAVAGTLAAIAKINSKTTAKVEATTPTATPNEEAALVARMQELYGN